METTTIHTLSIYLVKSKRWEDEIKTQEDIDKEILDYLKEMNPDETE